MFNKIKRVVNLITNMGLRYLFFRVFYAIKTKLGWIKKKYPVQPKPKNYITLEDWRSNTPPFFFQGKTSLNFTKTTSSELVNNFKDIKEGTFTYFSKSKINLGKNADWMINPSTGYRYDVNKHWSQVEDLSAEAGDIKYVWERARFSFLYDVIRYDYHYSNDQSKFVFSQIEDFIDKNPINQGPNYKCSQEISLRTLNWTFALYYYKDSDNLTEALFQKILNHIYWQLHHVYQNINFSRIAVRNNHAITETLMLYLSAKLFPFFPDVKKWSIKGKKWFEQEVAYQIYEDGTFLQFSMNYHRVVVQLLTWAIQLAKLNDDKFKDVVYDRAQKSLDFLDASKDKISGKLPNYGSNDGALFFKLTDDDYRVYTSQLEDLRSVLNGYSYAIAESVNWYGVKPKLVSEEPIDKLSTFKKGGYYIIQEDDVKTFIKCGKYKDRPAHSDNLHIDLWVNGNNILRDCGTYKYNTQKDLFNYFVGVESHNTVSISNQNQMLKGGRFIWYNWVNYCKASLSNNNTSFTFQGKIKAFKNLGNNIFHNRKVEKKKNQTLWKIEDTFINCKDREKQQYWHINPKFRDNISIITKDENNRVLKPIIEQKWFSGYYGFKEESIRLTFATTTNKLKTEISIFL